MVNSIHVIAFVILVGLNLFTNNTEWLKYLVTELAKEQIK